MTTFYTILTACVLNVCESIVLNNHADCETVMQRIYPELFAQDRGVYIGCKSTDVISSTMRPKARPTREGNDDL
jgi:hypothetical protein